MTDNKHINELSDRITAEMEGESRHDVALACASVIIQCIRDNPQSANLVIDLITAGAAILRADKKSEGKP
jgi:hypothetical protein